MSRSIIIDDTTLRDGEQTAGDEQVTPVGQRLERGWARPIPDEAPVTTATDPRISMPLRLSRLPFCRPMRVESSP